MLMPSNGEILTAIRDHGADVRLAAGWDSHGDWSKGCRGVINHHTATASASASNPAPSLWWCLNAYDKPVANMLVGKTPGNTWLLSAGPAYHCGNGGPWPDAGIGAGNHPDMMFGIEIDDPGAFGKYTLTDYQIEQTAKINVALFEVFGWPSLDRIITHGCWTNGCHGVNPRGPSLYVGRKNDTHEGAWGQWPGTDEPEPYNAPWWREQAGKILVEKPATWDGTVPKRSAAKYAMDEGKKNKAAWRLACRLYDLGYRGVPPKPLGDQKYPATAVQRARESWGWNPGRGGPSEKVWNRLFGTDKP